MKFLFYCCCFFFITPMLAQSSFSEADAKQIIDTFFEGFHKGDTLQMRAVMAPSMVLQTAAANSEGIAGVSEMPASNLLMAIASRPETQQWDERLLDYTVQIDGNLAHVWTRYEFWVNGNFSHCGANAFTLAKMNDGWKIIHLIDSRRRSDCKQD